MNKLTLSMMMAAAVALAAPAVAQAQPARRASFHTPGMKAYKQQLRQYRKMQQRIVALEQQKKAALSRVAKLKRRARVLRAQGMVWRLRRARRALTAERALVKKLDRKIHKLQRKLALRFHRLGSKISVKNRGRRAVIVEVRMGFSQRCSSNPRVAKRTLLRGQNLTVRQRGNVVCTRQIKRHPRRYRAVATRWVKRVLPHPGVYRFAVKPQRLKRHRATAVVLPARIGAL